MQISENLIVNQIFHGDFTFFPFYLDSATRFLNPSTRELALLTDIYVTLQGGKNEDRNTGMGKWREKGKDQQRI